MNYAQTQRKPGKHLIGIGLVILLHILLVYGLVNGLARKMMEVIKNPLEAKIIDEFKPLAPPPEKAPPPPKTPPPLPKTPPPPPEFVPKAEVPVVANAPAAVNAITAVTNILAPTPKAEEVQPSPQPKAVVRVAPVVRAASCEKPEYPPASRRMEEEGTVVLRFLIDEEGRVVESKVDSSSGSPRLDEAARAALSKCNFKPGSVDGQPDKAWASMKYTWKME